MVQIDDIRKLIRKHKYEVALKIIEDGEITALFPNRHEKPFCEPFNNIYTINTIPIADQRLGVVCDRIRPPSFIDLSIPVDFADFSLYRVIGNKAFPIIKPVQKSVNKNPSANLLFRKLFHQS